MRVLTIHNQLWAHYKSKLFAEIHTEIQDKYPNAAYKVIQIALYESSRVGMKSDQPIGYTYPYEVLFQKSLDEVGLLERSKALFRAYNTFQPTVLNITGYFDWAQVLLMLYARLTGVKVVMSTESGSNDHQRGGIKEVIKKAIVNTANAYFCFGTSSVKYLKQLGVSDSAIKVRNAAVVDDDAIRMVYKEVKSSVPARNKNFIYVGRLAAEKNLYLLLNAFARLQGGTDGTWELTFVGEGPLRNQLEKKANEVAPGKVHFVGGMPWNEVPKQFAKADALVLPSLSEPWGLVVNEAMICGLPVVVSEKCGCVDDLVLNQKTGYTFDPVNEEDLLQQLTAVTQLSDWEYNQMSENCQQVVQQFSAKGVAQQMVKAFAELN